MSDLITSIKIVDYNGELKTYDKPTSDATGITKEGMVSSPTPQDIFNAVRVSLGLFGVMVEMTLKVEDLQYADVHTSYPKVGEFFFGEKPAIVDMLRRYWSVETFWFPFNSIKLEDFFNYLQQVKDWDPKKDEVWVRAINHCNVPSDSIPNM